MSRGFESHALRAPVVARCRDLRDPSTEEHHVSELRPRAQRAAAPAPAVRHGRLKRGAAWKSALAFLGAAMAVVLVATGSVAAIAVWQLQDNIDTVAIGADGQAPPPNI